jgi:hypothetical protein
MIEQLDGLSVWQVIGVVFIGLSFLAVIVARLLADAEQDPKWDRRRGIDGEEY